MARTIVKLDSGSETIFPMRKNKEGVLEVDLGLFEIHQQHVATAIDYRARLLNALVSPIFFREKPGG